MKLEQIALREELENTTEMMTEFQSLDTLIKGAMQNGNADDIEQAKKMIKDLQVKYKNTDKSQRRSWHKEIEAWLDKQAMNLVKRAGHEMTKKMFK